MIVYHGSNHCFKTLKISKRLVQRRSTLENEGCGIYFSTDINVAKSYGKYIYTLEINDKYFKDFRHQNVCEKYIYDLYKYILNKYNINLTKYMILQNTINRMHWGGLAISGVGREIKDMLDSTYEFYEDISESKCNKLYQTLRNYDRKHLDAYMFPYHIQNIGVIKNVNSDVVKIISREMSY